jgi:hypothetical protein
MRARRVPAVALAVAADATGGAPGAVPGATPAPPSRVERWNAKTGWAARGRPGIGWTVGWVERDGRAWVFALNLDVRRDTDRAAREMVAVSILRERGLLD